MKYQAQLTPWVLSAVSQGETTAVSRFRRRNDADAYMKVLSKTKPEQEFVVSFDTANFTSPKKIEKALATA